MGPPRVALARNPTVTAEQPPRSVGTPKQSVFVVITLPLLLDYTKLNAEKRSDDVVRALAGYHATTGCSPPLALDPSIDMGST